MDVLCSLLNIVGTLRKIGERDRERSGKNKSKDSGI